MLPPLKKPDILSLSEFDYDLPHKRIAQKPLAERDQSKLLILNRVTGSIINHDTFANIASYFDPGDLLILNETKVSAVRLYGNLVPNGGAAEFLLTHRIVEGEWHALGKPGRKLRPGVTVVCSGELEVEILDIEDERGARRVRITQNGSVDGTDAVIDAVGKTPLPPYIHAENPNQYRDRYQTVYANYPGSAAAPTAGLHFTPRVLENLQQRGVETAKVTLHVGIGTFRPIESDNILDHTMHHEVGEISTETANKINQAKGRIIAVGTTSVRTLESQSIGIREVRAGQFRTDCYITPGYRFRVVDSMITNFHMPRSTLMVLVSAFAGIEPVRKAYSEAIAQNYRFLSFGDSMLIISAA